MAAAPKLALIATAQPSNPGVKNWIVDSESSSTRWASNAYFGGWPLCGDVGAVDEGAQGALGDRRLDLFGLGVVRDQWSRPACSIATSASPFLTSSSACVEIVGVG